MGFFGGREMVLARTTSADDGIAPCHVFLRRLLARRECFWLCNPYRKDPRNPETQKIECKEHDKTSLAAELPLSDQPSEVGGEIAPNHEDHIIDDKLHDAPSPFGRA